MQIFSNLEAISESFSGILLDAYGVFWGGNSFGLFPGAKQAMETLVNRGKIIGILSNCSQLAAKQFVKLEKHGLMQGVHFHFLITSGEVAKDIYRNEALPFRTDRKKFWLFGGPHPRFAPHPEIFEGTSYTQTNDIREADFIEISVPHLYGEDQTNPELFREEINKIIETNIPMVCINPDRFVLDGNSRKTIVRQGSIAALYEELGGAVFYIGKPSQLGYAAAMKKFAEFNIEKPKDILMAGDTPETDIRGARHFGMASALITKTGIMAERILRYGFEQAIDQCCSEDFPSFFIERL